MYATLHKPKNNIELYGLIFSYYFRKIYIEKLANRIYRKQVTSRELNLLKKDLSPMINLLPYDLTKSQSLAISEILNDMASDKRMNRILLGDVGSGKTIVSILASYISILNGYKGCIHGSLKYWPFSIIKNIRICLLA